MKSNKILILALSAGLVLSGAEYSQTYAAEAESNIAESATELIEYHVLINIPDEIPKGEYIKSTPDKILDTIKELAKEYQKKVPFEYVIYKADWLDDTSYEVHFKKNKPINPAPVDENAALKEEYNSKIDRLSDLTNSEKTAAKKAINEAITKQEIINAYNAAYSKNQDAAYIREQEEIKQAFENYKETAKGTIAKNPNNLPADRLREFKDRIDKAPTKGAVNQIMDEFGEAKPNPDAVREYEIFILIPGQIPKGENIKATPLEIDYKVKQLAEEYKKEVNLEYHISGTPEESQYTINFKKAETKEQIWQVIVQYPDGSSENKTISALPGQEYDKVEELAKTYNLQYTIVFDDVSKIYLIRLQPAKNTEIAEYQTIRRPNPDMYIGEEKIIQKGQNGLWTFDNGVKKLTKSPVDEIIEYGTKEKAKNTEIAEYQTIRRPNPEMYIGEEKVVQKGKNGLWTFENGVRKLTKSPVDEIIEYGTKERSKKTKIAEYRTIRIPNKDMYTGTERLIQTGKNGEWTYIDGRWVLTTNPIDEKIEYGTKERVENNEVAEYQTRRIANKDMYVGTEKIVQAGKNGEWTYINGRRVLTTAPVDEIIHYGTKPLPARFERIPYRVIRRSNPNLHIDTEKVVQEGREGLWVFENGRWALIQNPIDKIVEYGTKPGVISNPPITYIPRVSVIPTYTPAPTPTIPTTTTGTIPTLKDSNKIVVGKGKTYLQAGTYDKAKLQDLRQSLITSYEKNREIAQAAQWLIDNTPQTIAKVRGKLDAQLANRKKLQNQAKTFIKELDEVLGLKYNSVY